MKELANKPLLFALLLALPLWLVIGNFLVAAMIGLFTGFFVSMSVSLYRLKKSSKAAPTIHSDPLPNPSHTMSFPSPEHPAGLPPLEAAAAEHHQKMVAHLQREIQAQPKQFMPFEHWMDRVLYAPGLGYYTAGSAKFPDEHSPGDFTTAPELTPFYGRALAQQVAQILQLSDSHRVIEFGAGSGILAHSLITALRKLGIEPEYTILEVSADLRERQAQRLETLDANVQWRDNLPRHFEGCVIANEVLDAMPVTLFQWDENGQLMEKGVTLGQPFSWAQRPASGSLTETVSARMPALPGYTSEINLRAEAWVEAMGQWLQKGAALLIDYGFPAHEYYHPQRAQGTLMCHFRHHAHAEPLIYAGMQDITAHVNFTAIANAALNGGLDVSGYTSQARFLINTGLIEQLSQVSTSENDPLEQARLTSSVQTLLSEAEMGELFKVMAIGKGLVTPLTGFKQGDRRHRL